MKPGESGQRPRSGRRLGSVGSAKSSTPARGSSHPEATNQGRGNCVLESATQLALPKLALAADRKLGASFNIALCFAVARLGFVGRPVHSWRSSTRAISASSCRHAAAGGLGPRRAAKQAAATMWRIRFLLRRVTCAAPRPGGTPSSLYHVKPTVKGQP